MENLNIIQKDFNGIIMNVTPDDRYEFTLTTEEIAQGYGVAKETIRYHQSKYKEDLLEGKHFFKGARNTNTLANQQPHQTYWTKQGVIRLGFFIKSERARLFRDWIEDLIIDKMSEDKGEYLSLEDFALFGESDNDGIVFYYGKMPLRCIPCDDGVYRFVGYEIAACCGFKTTRNRIARSLPLEMLRKVPVADGMGRLAKTWCADLETVKTFMKHVKLKKALPFKSWVMSTLTSLVKNLESGEPMPISGNGRRKLPPHMTENITAALNKAIAKEVAKNIFKALQGGKIKLSF